MLLIKKLKEFVEKKRINAFKHVKINTGAAYLEKATFNLTAPELDDQTIRCKLTIGDQDFWAIVDTNHSCSFISDNLVQKLPRYAYVSEPCSISVAMVSGSENVVVNSCLEIVIHYREALIHHKLLVTNTCEDKFTLGGYIASGLNAAAIQNGLPNSPQKKTTSDDDVQVLWASTIWDLKEELESSLQNQDILPISEGDLLKKSNVTIGQNTTPLQIALPGILVNVPEIWAGPIWDLKEESASSVKNQDISPISEGALRKKPLVAQATTQTTTTNKGKQTSVNVDSKPNQAMASAGNMMAKAVTRKRKREMTPLKESTVNETFNSFDENTWPESLKKFADRFRSQAEIGEKKRRRSVLNTDSGTRYRLTIKYNGEMRAKILNPKPPKQN